MWKGIREQEPEEHMSVIVARDHFDDGAYDYFIGRYWVEEDEWQVFLTMETHPKSTYVNITIPVKEGDKWAYFEEAT